jgi:hypothetical protein
MDGGPEVGGSYDSHGRGRSGGVNAFLSPLCLFLCRYDPALGMVCTRFTGRFHAVCGRDTLADRMYSRCKEPVNLIGYDLPTEPSRACLPTPGTPAVLICLRKIFFHTRPLLFANIP